jgi:hypothetical protein
MKLSHHLNKRILMAKIGKICDKKRNKTIRIVWIIVDNPCSNCE